MANAILALDQGTTSSKALLVDASGTVLASGSAPLGISFPAPGRVEQDADDLWDSVVRAASEALVKRPDVVVVGVAVSNQRESVVGWDAAGDAAGPVVSWQDARGADAIDALPADVRAAIRARTGLEANPAYSASKFAWLQRAHDPARMGTVDAWLVHRLTGGATFAIEAGNASRTQLLDLGSLAWDADLAAAFGVDLARLPEVHASAGDWGRTLGLPGVPDGTPILAVLGDSHAALFGHWALAPDVPGAGKVTYGTGSSTMIPTPDAASRVDGVSTTLAWLDGAPQYAYEGNILYAGAGLNWLAATLGLPDAAALGALAATTPDPGTAVFVPALNGIGSPWWRPDAVGTLTGLTASTTRAQVARAGIDSVAHQVCDIVDALDPGRAFPLLHAGGGATASEVLMQSQADLLGRTLLVSAVADISPVGAAALAWRALGVPLAPAAGLVPRLVHPSADADARRAAARESWRDALVRAGVPRLQN